MYDDPMPRMPTSRNDSAATLQALRQKRPHHRPPANPYPRLAGSPGPSSSRPIILDKSLRVSSSLEADRLGLTDVDIILALSGDCCMRVLPALLNSCETAHRRQQRFNKIGHAKRQVSYFFRCRRRPRPSDWHLLLIISCVGGTDDGKRAAFCAE